MDASLYPHHKPKNTPKEISTSSALAFTSTLSSLLSTSSSSRTTPGRPRPSKNKTDIFASHNKNTKKRAARDLKDDDHHRGRSSNIGGVEDVALHRSKRKLEEKAKLYKSMKRGEARDEDGLVDFDRKWAEREGGESDDDVESDDGQGEIIDYEDEYGRARRGTKAEAERVQRRKQSRLLGAEELDRMSARPAVPKNLIYGDTVQSLAFNLDEQNTQQMEALARKRDRSITPPDAKHYEADKEFRIKGVGFFNFSKDQKIREQEMEALGKERLETERIRREREDIKEQRRQEIEERRKAIGQKRAKKRADNFLNGMSAEMGITPASEE